MSRAVPLQFVATSPKYLDKKIAEIQVKMDEISWINKSFARAYRHAELNGENEKIYLPAVYQGDGLDYWNCLNPTDFQNFSFVYVQQPQDVEEDSPYVLTAEISIIVFFDLTTIGTLPDYRFTELLKEDCLVKIRKVGNLTVNQTFDEIEACYSDFSFAEIKLEFLQEKFGALRFDCTIKTSQNCLTTNTYS